MNATNSKVVIGYTSVWSPIDFNAIPASKLSHINFSFLNINTDDGSLIFGDEDCDECCAVKYLNNLLEVKQKNTHLKIYLSVGGSKWVSSFLPVAQDPDKRARLGDDLNNLLTNYGLDGVDLDWEYPESGQGTYFVQLSKDIRAKLNSTFELTAAVPSVPEYLKNYNLKDCHSYFNWFNLMAYDASLKGGYASHLAPFTHNPNNPNIDHSSERGVKSLLALNVPYNKIALGIPLYAYQYEVIKGDDKHGLFRACTNNCDVAIKNKEINDTDKGNRYFDDASKVPWYYNAESGLFTTFEDSQSVQIKVDYIKKNNLRGIFFWELGQDSLGSDSVVVTASKSFNVSTAPLNNFQLNTLPMPGTFF
eukprot:NODE_9_length_47730_cov_0.323718.p9 type:complete len:363 gc:universal NODE_9_length_47730_cov_0.323718:35785-34697(-)